MAEDKKSFLMYADWIHTIEMMPDDKAGILLKTLFRYVNDQNPVVDDLVVNLVFEPIKRQMKRDLEKWEEVKGDKSKGGSLGNLKRYNRDLYDKVVAQLISLEEAIILAKDRKASHTDKERPESVAPVAVNVTATVNATVINKKGIAEFLLFESAKETDPVFYDFVDSYKKILLETFPNDFMSIQLIPLMNFSEIAREMIELYEMKDIKKVFKNAGQSTFWKPQLYNLAAIHKNFMAIKNIEIVKTGKSEAKPSYTAPAPIDFKTLE